MKLIVLLFVLCNSLFLNAHPSVSVIIDSKGNIFYSDLSAVWKIDVRGKRSIAVPRVHTHVLYMDAFDNLYGEDATYSGEATNKYFHSIWQLSFDNKLRIIKPKTEGFYIENYSFVRDKAATMYWVRLRGSNTSLMKTTADHKTFKIADGDFHRVQWMHIANEKLYYVQYDGIYSYTRDGKKVPVALLLCGKEKKHNSLYSLWSDRSGNIYVANGDKKAIQKITSSKLLITIYRSEGQWFPTGGVFDRSGRLYVLEWNDKGETRVKRTQVIGE